MAHFPSICTPGYRSTVKRSPSKPLIVVPHTLSELTGPVYGHDAVQDGDNDLTKQHKGEPLGERIIVHGQVLDEDKRPVPDALVEMWQANACGRYVHIVDQHPAPLDPNFTGAGRTVTDKDGYYKFITVKPGAYPWGNHHNAWRPNHIHFSVFGHSFLSRLVTQMYFPGDSAVPVRSDLQFGDRREGARSAWSRASIWKTPCRIGRCASASTSCCAAAKRRRSTRTNTKRMITKMDRFGKISAGNDVGHHAVADRRAVLRLWPHAEGPLPVGPERQL